MKKYVPDAKSRTEIIAKGIAQERPVFADGIVGKRAPFIPKEEKDGVARYIADKLNTDILAPNIKVLLYAKNNGVCKAVPETSYGEKDGDWVIFTPNNKKK